MKRIAALFAFILLATFTVEAQYNLNTWTGGQSQFTTYAQLMGGMTEPNQLTISIQRYNGDNSIDYRWRVTVRLTQDFINGANSVGAEYASLSFNSQTNNSTNPSNIPITNSLVQLSKTAEATVIDSNVPLTNTVERVFKFNLAIQGGNHLLTKPNATYNSAYEVKLYKINPAGVATHVDTHTVGSARFQIEYSLNNNASLVVQNGANNYNLQFTNASDYATGKSVTVNSGIKIAGGNFNNYQMSVKASGPFTSSTSSSTIPLNVLRTEITSVQFYQGITIVSPITPSTADQTVVYRSSGGQWNSEMLFNLRFYIPPNGLTGVNVPAGTYTTYVYFVLTPN